MDETWHYTLDLWTNPDLQAKTSVLSLPWSRGVSAQYLDSWTMIDRYFFDSFIGPIEMHLELKSRLGNVFCLSLSGAYFNMV
jgi:hypothetical protein